MTKSTQNKSLHAHIACFIEKKKRETVYIQAALATGYPFTESFPLKKP